MRKRERKRGEERDSHGEEGGDEEPRGVDALEEGRWGVRERCGSSEEWDEGLRGRARELTEGGGAELTASERVGYG